MYSSLIAKWYILASNHDIDTCDYEQATRIILNDTYAHISLSPSNIVY